MYGFWRLGVEPGAVDGGRLRAERARDGDEDEGEEGRDPGDHRHDPGDEVAQQPAVHRDRERAVPGQDEQPQEQRALLAAPEGGQRVDGRAASRLVCCAT